MIIVTYNTQTEKDELIKTYNLMQYRQFHARIKDGKKEIVFIHQSEEPEIEFSNEVSIDERLNDIEAVLNGLYFPKTSFLQKIKIGLGL